MTLVRVWILIALVMCTLMASNCEAGRVISFGTINPNEKECNKGAGNVSHCRHIRLANAYTRGCPKFLHCRSWATPFMHACMHASRGMHLHAPKRLAKSMNHRHSLHLAVPLESFENIIMGSLLNRVVFLCNAFEK